MIKSLKDKVIQVYISFYEYYYKVVTTNLLPK